jgi:hypothetical protein
MINRIVLLIKNPLVDPQGRHSDGIEYISIFKIDVLSLAGGFIENSPEIYFRE